MYIIFDIHTWVPIETDEPHVLYKYTEQLAERYLYDECDVPVGTHTPPILKEPEWFKPIKRQLECVSQLLMRYRQQHPTHDTVLFVHVIDRDLYVYIGDDDDIGVFQPRILTLP